MKDDGLRIQPARLYFRLAGGCCGRMRGGCKASKIRRSWSVFRRTRQGNGATIRHAADHSSPTDSMYLLAPQSILTPKLDPCHQHIHSQESFVLMRSREWRYPSQTSPVPQSTTSSCRAASCSHLSCHSQPSAFLTSVIRPATTTTASNISPNNILYSSIQHHRELEL